MFIGSSLSVWELEHLLIVENIEISLYAQAKLDSRFYFEPKAIFTIVWDS